MSLTEEELLKLNSLDPNSSDPNTAFNLSDDGLSDGEIIGIAIGAAVLGGVAYKFRGEIRQGYMMKMPDLVVPDWMKKQNFIYKQKKNLKKMGKFSDYGFTPMNRNFDLDTSTTIKIGGQDISLSRRIPPEGRPSLFADGED